MRPRWTFLFAVGLAAWLAGLGLGQTPGETAPPWKPFAAFIAVGVDGKPAPVMITPGPVPGSWVAIVGGSCVWQMTPLDVPGPTPPVPPAPPGPTPPIPPVPPTPAEDAKRLALAAAEKLPAEGRHEDAQKLAAVYRALAEQIPKTIDSIDKLITANRYAREIALGPQRSKVWEPWVKEIGVWLDARRAAGAIKTVEDCKPVWLAIAEGLAVVK
jgi:hypothetical protein